MTLQYRTRDMSEDRRWERLLRLLLLDTVDQWCRDDSGFPAEFLLSSILHLFSFNCKPFTISENGLQGYLAEAIQTPEGECARAQPTWSFERKNAMVDSLKDHIEQQLAQWENGDTISPAIIGDFAQVLVDNVVRLKYVVFHRTQTTSRDHGGFHGFW